MLKVILSFFVLWFTCDLIASDCVDFSHVRILDTVNAKVIYKQQGCDLFHKTFYDLTTEEILLEEEIAFTENWKIEVIDNAAQTYEKKTRIYWAPRKDKLIEDYVIDGYSKINARMKRFYRTKSLSYDFDENKENVFVSGHDFHRYEFVNGEMEIESKLIKDLYKKIN